MRTFFFALSLATALASSWVKQASLLQARSDVDAEVYGDWFFVGGGCIQNQSTTADCPEITDSFEAYNVLNNSWTSLPNLPRKRYRHSCVLVNDTIYFIAGRDQGGFNIIQELDIYNITSQTWRTVLQNATLTSDGTAFFIGNKIYYTGGYDQNYTLTSNQTLVLDLDVSEQFQAGIVAEKTVRTGDLFSKELNGLAYVFGGFSTDNGFSQPFNTLEVYNPSTNTWTLKQNFISGRGDMAGAVINGFLYLIGGEAKKADGVSYPVANVEVYNPSADSWRELTPIAESRFRFTSAAYDTLLYNIGGQLSEVDPAGGDPYFPITNHVYSYDTSMGFANSLTLFPLLIVALGIMMVL